MAILDIRADRVPAGYPQGVDQAGGEGDRLGRDQAEHGRLLRDRDRRERLDHVLVRAGREGAYDLVVLALHGHREAAVPKDHDLPDVVCWLWRFRPRRPDPATGR